MMATRRRQRTYDLRLRELVRETGDPSVVEGLGVPRSTVSGWLHGERKQVVSLDVVQTADPALRRDVIRLRRRVRVLQALVRLLVVVVRLSRFRLDGKRMPDGVDKRAILEAVDGASGALRHRTALRVVHLSASRYHAWKRAEQCGDLNDRTSCPRSVSWQLTPGEVASMREMATSRDFRHMPSRTLSLHAQRIGRVFASVSTWARMIRVRGWRRPRRRVHPRKPKLGLRATRPDEAWHIDTSVIRLVDGTKVYLHAVIDNFSRRILAWKVADAPSPASTCEILALAARGAGLTADAPATVVVDAGVENINTAVDELIATGLLRRVLAQVDVQFSNSMIEAWWRSLKHQWLFLHSLESIQDVRRLAAFYVTEHNGTMPHSAFHGQTPDEMYDGTGEAVPAQLEEARRKAREARMSVNRAMSCEECLQEDSGENVLSA